MYNLPTRSPYAETNTFGHCSTAALQLSPIKSSASMYSQGSISSRSQRRAVPPSTRRAPPSIHHSTGSARRHAAPSEIGPPPPHPRPDSTRQSGANSFIYVVIPTINSGIFWKSAADYLDRRESPLNLGAFYAACVWECVEAYAEATTPGICHSSTLAEPIGCSNQV